MNAKAKLVGGAIVTGCLALPVPAAFGDEPLIGSTNNDRVVLFSSDDPRDTSKHKIQGLSGNDKVAGLDVRPCTGKLWALGTDDATGQLYTIRVNERRDRAIAKARGERFGVDGDTFGFDFNPVVDRIRITSDSNQNLRVSPGPADAPCPPGMTPAPPAGTVTVDGPLAYTEGDPNAGEDPDAAGAAYTNNEAGATETELYGIDVAQDVLFEQDPPNDGTLNTDGEIGPDAKNPLGFDIAGSDGTAYAAIKREGKDSRLYEVDLDSGDTDSQGRIDGSAPLRTLATLGNSDEN